MGRHRERSIEDKDISHVKEDTDIVIYLKANLPYRTHNFWCIRTSIIQFVHFFKDKDSMRCKVYFLLVGPNGRLNNEQDF